MNAIESQKEVSYLRGILVTGNAQDFYKKYGFVENDGVYMGRPKKSL